MTTIATRASSIEHITITTDKSFDDAKRDFEAAFGRFDERIFTLLGSGDIQGGLAAMEALAPLVIAGERDHGILLKTIGLDRKAIQYDCGNALTASRMTRNDLSAGMYAPIRVLLSEDGEGHAVIEYDRPSATFAQFHNPAIDEVTAGLDQLFAETLRKVAS